MGRIGKKHRTEPSLCLNCKSSLDAAAMLDGDSAPSPGDFTVCVDCGYVMVFADDLSFRELTHEELLEANDDPDVRMVVRAVIARHEAVLDGDL